MGRCFLLLSRQVKIAPVIDEEAAAVEAYAALDRPDSDEEMYEPSIAAEDEPFQPWCDDCVGGKSKESPHRRRSAEEEVSVRDCPLSRSTTCFWAASATSCLKSYS